MSRRRGWEEKARAELGGGMLTIRPLVGGAACWWGQGHCRRLEQYGRPSRVRRWGVLMPWQGDGVASDGVLANLGIVLNWCGCGQSTEHAEGHRPGRGGSAVVAGGVVVVARSIAKRFALYRSTRNYHRKSVPCAMAHGHGWELLYAPPVKTRTPLPRSVKLFVGNCQF